MNLKAFIHGIIIIQLNDKITGLSVCILIVETGILPQGGVSRDRLFLKCFVASCL